MTRRKAILLLLSLLLSSCQKVDKKDEPLVIIDSINVTKESSYTDSFAYSLIGNLINSPFVYFKNDMISTHNVMARVIKILPGNKEVEISLKEGIRFHDGREFSTRDILPMIDKYQGKQSTIFGNVYEDLQVEIIDKKNFKLSHPNPILDVRVLANLWNFPHDNSGNPVGTGPFKIERWLDKGVELTANEDYFDGPPRLKKIIYLYEEDERKRLYKLLKGEADLTIFLSPDAANFLKKDGRFYVNGEKHSNYNAIIFNKHSPIFADKAIRKAFSMAINRDMLIEKAVKGSGMQAFGPFKLETHDEPHSQSYHPKEAARLLKDAGWKYKGKNIGLLEKNNKKMILSIAYSKEVANFKRLVSFINQQLFEVGIRVNWIPVDFDELIKLQWDPKDYDARMLTLPATDRFNYISWNSSSKNKLYNFNNEELDRLLKELVEGSEIKKREVYYDRLQEIFNKEIPAAFLYYDVIYSAANTRFNGASNFNGHVYSVYKIKDWTYK